ncbi:hypothetical protein CEXT_762331 [Caerostris extrusa]|uniref:Uncharacterized protein n=1 Tax=Caerostris extrusa TaxID=172846 RepID=A0AAV4YAV8_CAEEX|nr:hypothetical protein CEXT_762331 [Caerostris extrusa]
MSMAYVHIDGIHAAFIAVTTPMKCGKANGFNVGKWIVSCDSPNRLPTDYILKPFTVESLLHNPFLNRKTTSYIFSSKMARKKH